MHSGAARGTLDAMPIVPERIHTERLTLAPNTPELAALCAAGDWAGFGRALGADVPDRDWPPWVLDDVLGVFADKLRERPEDVGWWGWWFIARPGVVAPGARAIVIGSCGCNPPDENGRVLVGYSTVPAYEGRGFTSEAFAAFLEGWPLKDGRVKTLEATTFERHHASRRILEKTGFVYVGVSPDDAEASERDRQGRGKIILYRWAGQRGGTR